MRIVYMDISKMTPIVLYDDRCYLCTLFAGVVGKFGRGRVLIVGHYSPLGEEIRSSLLESDALDMFWLIDSSTAYGGRAALIPLLKTLLLAKIKKFDAPDTKHQCDASCKNASAVFVRSASLLTNSRKISLWE